MTVLRKLVIPAFVLCIVWQSKAQEPLPAGQVRDASSGLVINLDEAYVPAYILPDLLTTEGGEKVTTPERWTNERRPEILEAFTTQVYGRAPGRPDALEFEDLSVDRYALSNMATRKEVKVWFDEGKTRGMTILIYLPNKNQGAVPLFFGLNFKGNHSVNDDPYITMSETRAKPREGQNEEDSRDWPRGSEASRWPIEMLIANGYGVATVYRGDIDPDYDNPANGVQSLYYAEGQTHPADDEWATLAAWAWGMSRAMDYFETDEDIDASRVAIVGHSRHGKTTLWAGATDERFALVISNESGCGGAALSRRRLGETVARINHVFPYWFCENFKQYSGNEDVMPVDQHQLIALMAPRPVYIASAAGDTWADPKGEYLSGVHATPVYELFGLEGLYGQDQPPVDTPVQNGHIGYHVRTGGHDINLYDWRQYVKFADKHLRK